MKALENQSVHEVCVSPRYLQCLQLCVFSISPLDIIKLLELKTTCAFLLLFSFLNVPRSWVGVFSANILVYLKPISTLGLDVLGSRRLNFRA